MNVKRLLLIFTVEITLIAITAGITKMALEDIPSLLIWSLVFVFALISIALFVSDQTDRANEQKAVQDRISELKLNNRWKILNLRSFMNKSHAWALGDVGRCTDIPEGSRLVELNDGSYQISTPVYLEVKVANLEVGSKAKIKVIKPTDK